MARIPIYRERQSPSGGFSTGTARAVDRGGRAIAGGMQDMGRALNQVAQNQLNIAEERAKAQAEERASEFNRQWTEKEIELESSPEVPVEGHRQYVMGAYQQFKDEYVQDLPEQSMERRLVESSIRRRGDIANERAIVFEAEQGRKRRVSRINNSITNNATAIALDPNPEHAEAVLGETLATIDSMQLTASERESLKQSARTTFATTGAEAYARTNPLAMIQEFESARAAGADTTGNFFLDNLPAEQIDRYVELAKNNLETVSAQRAARGAWDTVLGGQTGQPITDDQINEMTKFVESQMPASDEVYRQSAKAIVNNMARTYNARQRDEENAYVADVWNNVLGGRRTLNEVMDLPAWNNLNAEQRAKTLTNIDTFLREPPDETQMLATYERLKSDPSTVAGLSQRDIFELAPSLGEANTRKLLEFHQGLQEPGALENQQIDENDFQTVADEFGFFDEVTEDGAQKARVRLVVERQLDLEAQRTGRDLTRDEKNKVYRQVFSDTVFDPSGWGTTEKPWVFVARDDRDRAYVKIGEERVRLGNIPAQQRVSIREDLQLYGMRFTQENLALLSMVPEQQRKYILEQQSRLPNFQMTPQTIFDEYQRAK